MSDRMNQRQKDDLDNYITGHYGEDQFDGEDKSDSFSLYLLQPEEKSFCKYCKKNVELLTPQFPSPGDVMFYVCFDCRKIFEIGVREVPRI